MNKYFAAGIIFTAFMSGPALSAPDSEYLQFLEKYGGEILNIYRIPEGADLSYWGSDRDTYFYKTLDSDLEEKSPFWTKGYFNSDGYPDFLFILFHRTSNQAFLIGFMSYETTYKSLIIEPSDKYMAVATKKNIAGHYHLEGHGQGLSWNEKDAKFEIVQ